MESGTVLVIAIAVVAFALFVVTRPGSKRMRVKPRKEGTSPRPPRPGFFRKPPLPVGVSPVTVDQLIGEVIIHLSYVLRVDISTFAIAKEYYSENTFMPRPMIDHVFRRLDLKWLSGETLVTDNDLRKKVILAVVWVMIRYEDIDPMLSLMNPPAFDRLNSWVHRVGLGDTRIANPDNNAISQLMREP